MTSVRGSAGGALRADSDLRAARAGGSRACCEGLTALRRARWDLAVLAELAERGTMTLATLRDRQGRIRDFEWLEATPTATMHLGCPGADLVGATLRDRIPDGYFGELLFLTCQRAVLSGKPQEATIELGGRIALHEVQPTPTGVVVVLTSTAAIARVVAAQDALRRIEPLHVIPAPGLVQAVGAGAHENRAA